MDKIRRENAGRELRSQDLKAEMAISAGWMSKLQSLTDSRPL